MKMKINNDNDNEKYSIIVMKVIMWIMKRK